MRIVTASVIVRRAVPGDDLDNILDLADARRRQYATYQPVFWRPAPDAVSRQRPHLAALLNDDAVIALVAARGQAFAGFAIGTVVPAPPVYNPGGLTCIVDDFAVADPDDWPSVGVDLPQAVCRTARQHGATQIVVVAGYLDAAKRAALVATALGIASEWWDSLLDTD